MSVRTWRVGAVAIAAGTLLASHGAWAQSACQAVGSSVCGAGSGVILSVSGDVSLGRAGAVNPVGGGAAISSGDRILANNGTAQVSLGPTCVVCVGPSAVSVASQQNGLTCLSNTSACSAGETGFNPALGIAGIALVGGIAIAVSQHSVSP